MALRPCRECGASVSTEAPFCPRCGSPEPTRGSDPPAPPPDPQTASPAADDTLSWHYIQGGARHGPVTRSELLDLLRRGEVAHDTSVKSDRGMYWLPIARVPELSAHLPPEAARAAEVQTRAAAYRTRLRQPPVQRSPDEERHQQSARTLGHVVYGLQAASFIFGVPLFVALIVNYAGRESVRGTYVNSHFDWQIGTFWGLLLWWLGALAVAIAMGGSVAAFLLIYLPSIPWLLYRVIRGWIRLNDEEPM